MNPHNPTCTQVIHMSSRLKHLTSFVPFGEVAGWGARGSVLKIDQ